MKARDNPFRVARVHALGYLPQKSNWSDIMSRLRGLSFRAAITGPFGSGKTALLDALAPRLTTLGYTAQTLRLSMQQRSLPRGFTREFWDRVVPNDVILLDEADQLGRAAWLGFKRESRAAAGLVITTRRPGLLPTLVECTTSPELLMDLVRALVLNDAHGLRDKAHELYSKHEGNLREAIRELYDVYAGM